ncbi:MAG: hypothetical protein ACXW3X_11105, partial [Rhodoplanes sp.]
RTGLERSVMVGYFEDGPNLVTMAMNGWGEGEPAWWLNLQSHPDASGKPAASQRQAITPTCAPGTIHARSSFKIWHWCGRQDCRMILERHHGSASSQIGCGSRAGEHHGGDIADAL